MSSFGRMFDAVSRIIISTDNNAAVASNCRTIENDSMAAQDLSTAVNSDYEMVNGNCMICKNQRCPEETKYPEALKEGYDVVDGCLNLVLCRHCGEEFVHLLCLFRKYNEEALFESCECADYFKKNIKGHAADFFKRLTISRNPYMIECVRVLFLDIDNDTIMDICDFKERTVLELIMLGRLGNQILMKLITGKDKDFEMIKKVNFILAEITDKLTTKWDIEEDY